MHSQSPPPPLFVRGIPSLPFFRLVLLIASAGVTAGVADAPPAPTLKTERFDRDPDWEGYNNHIAPKRVSVVKQDFGYSATNFAGKSAGELGGVVQRASTPAFYAAPLAPAKTLNDRLTASGSFAITATSGGAGVFFGFFNSQQPGGSGRAIGSLGMDFDFEQTGGRLALRLITGGNKSCGTFITPYLPGKYRPTPIKNDGTRYHWTLNYNPEAADGSGQFTFTMTSDHHPAGPLDPALPEASQQEARSRFPYTTTFTVDLPPDFKKEGASFDRFGLINGMKSGHAATIFFDDLEIDGKTEDFSQDPGWVGMGNRTSYEDREQGGAHDFGFLPTYQAGGSPGEIGGLIWRSPYAYYADRVGPLSLQSRLEARGRIVLAVGAPDSGVFLGWFNSSVKTAEDHDPLKGRNLIGVSIGGPTRIGHYFLPFCSTVAGGRAVPKSGPVLKPGQTYEWTFVFDPAANGGHGQMRATLGGESVAFDLRPGQKPDDVAFDRFGLVAVGTGGGQVKIYLDDLTYSAAQP
jgi:hypothetical protein